MTDRHTRKDRLERAGYRHVQGWVPEEFWRSAMALVDAHRSDVERIVAEPPKPIGWPKGKPRKETMK